MEMVANGFTEMSQDEELIIDGGDAVLAAIIGAAALLFTCGFNAGQQAALNRINRN